MKKTYESPVAKKVVFDYMENVSASQTGGNYGPWEKTNVSNPWYTCDSSYKDANGVCGYNGRNISNPNYECNN